MENDYSVGLDINRRIYFRLFLYYLEDLGVKKSIIEIDGQFETCSKGGKFDR